MPTFLTKIETKHISFMLNILVSLFFITVLMFKKGYSYVPMTLGGISVIYLLLYIFKFKKKWVLDKDDKWLIFAFLAYFATFVMSAIVHGDGFRVIDNPSRILLFIPLILLFSQFPINQKVLLHAIPIGSAVTGLLAIYQKFALNLERPFPEIMSIQAGDIAMTLGTLSLAITTYLVYNKQYKIALLYLIFSFLGMYSSILTLTRGAWITVIVTLPLIFLLYKKKLNIKLIIVGLISLIALISFSLSSPFVKERANLISIEIHDYFEHNNSISSIGARLDMWKGTILAAQEKPILGWGYKGYSQFKKELAEKGIANPIITTFTSEHNQYLDTLAKRGLVGLIALLSIFFVPFIYFYKKYKENEINQSIAVLGFIHITTVMVYCLTQSFFSHNSGSIFYFFGLVIFYCALKHQKTQSI